MGVMGVFDDDTFGHSVACLCGVALSLYALWVEVQKHRNPKYVAMCDLGDNMQCSRVLTSELVSYKLLDDVSSYTLLDNVSFLFTQGEPVSLKVPPTEPPATPM